MVPTGTGTKHPPVPLNEVRVSLRGTRCEATAPSLSLNCHYSAFVLPTVVVESAADIPWTVVSIFLPPMVLVLWRPGQL